jgi:hypothetical protein
MYFSNDSSRPNTFGVESIAMEGKTATPGFKNEY